MSDDIGGCLRRAREDRGMSLRDIAARTKLPITVLQAIERNDFASLPAGMFRSAYVRTVAAEVGLDPRQIAAAYCARFADPAALPAATRRNAAVEQEWFEQLTPPPRGSLLTFAAAAILAAAWFMLQRG